MKKVVILIGGCQFNRGSEAMVRGVVKMLKKQNDNLQISLSSRDDNTGKSLSIKGVDKYIRYFGYNRNNKLIRYPISVLRYIFRLKNLTNWINHYALLNECKEADLVIVIGGDNFDKAYGAFNDMFSLHKTLRKIVTGKMIILNCSVNTNEINEDIIKDLGLFDKITVRESITYGELSKRFSNDRLEYYPDIAFTMDAQAVKLPECFLKGDVVGINLSPLILRNDYTSEPELILHEYYDVIDYVVNELKKQVLLIPHVMNNADLSVLKRIYKHYEGNDNVHLWDDESSSAPELKYVIAHCYMYLGARTHSTIAAYSSYVPTLVLGYSVKSVGIARDLFDTEEEFVVPIQTITESGTLLKAFKKFAKNRQVISDKLRVVIPGYIEKAEGYCTYLNKMVGSEEC